MDPASVGDFLEGVGGGVEVEVDPEGLELTEDRLGRIVVFVRAPFQRVHQHVPRVASRQLAGASVVASTAPDNVHDVEAKLTQRGRVREDEGQAVDLQRLVGALDREGDDEGALDHLAIDVMVGRGADDAVDLSAVADRLQHVRQRGDEYASRLQFLGRDAAGGPEVDRDTDDAVAVNVVAALGDDLVHEAFGLTGEEGCNVEGESGHVPDLLGAEGVEGAIGDGLLDPLGHGADLGRALGPAVGQEGACVTEASVSGEIGAVLEARIGKVAGVLRLGGGDVVGEGAEADVRVGFFEGGGEGGCHRGIIHRGLRGYAGWVGEVLAGGRTLPAGGSERGLDLVHAGLVEALPEDPRFDLLPTPVAEGQVFAAFDAGAGADAVADGEGVHDLPDLLDELDPLGLFVLGAEVGLQCLVIAEFDLGEAVDRAAVELERADEGRVASEAPSIARGKEREVGVGLDHLVGEGNVTVRRRRVEHGEDVRVALVNFVEQVDAAVFEGQPEQTRDVVAVGVEVAKQLGLSGLAGHRLGEEWQLERLGDRTASVGLSRSNRTDEHDWLADGDRIENVVEQGVLTTHVDRGLVEVDDLDRTRQDHRGEDLGDDLADSGLVNRGVGLLDEALEDVRQLSRAGSGGVAGGGDSGREGRDELRLGGGRSPASGPEGPLVGELSKLFHREGVEVSGGEGVVAVGDGVRHTVAYPQPASRLCAGRRYLLQIRDLLLAFPILHETFPRALRRVPRHGASYPRQRSL